MKKAVVLMNLGSPDSTSIPDVSRYLKEFLMDERVIDKPWLLRAILVKGIIVPFRAPKSAKAYASIWIESGSPLLVISEKLRAEVEKEAKLPVVLAMRYGHPTPAQAFDQLLENNPDLEEVLAIPLYPHYAMSSFETAVEHAKKAHSKSAYKFALEFTPPFYNNEQYISALAESIRPFIEKEYDQILFSYHGIPERHLRKTDPTHAHCLVASDCCNTPSVAHETCYRHQCFATTRLVADRLDIPEEKRGLSFQSRLGRDPWLQPYTVARLKTLPAEGVKKLLVVCPAFVSDCLETIEEMGEEGREVFLSNGGEEFTLIPCLNNNQPWINTLVAWIHETLEPKDQAATKE